MSEKFDQIKYVSEYNKKTYDRIEVKVPKGTKEHWRQRAKAEKKSLNEWIVGIIKAAIGEKNEDNS